MTDGVFKDFTQYGYLSADPTDPKYQYNQDIFSITWQGTGTDGIQTQTGIDSFKVTGQTPAAMAVNIERGFIWIQGFVGWLQAADSLTVSPADPTYPRIDRVIARLDRTEDKKISFGIIEGTPAATPTAPTLTQTADDVYEVALYQIYVDAGAITITDGDLTDERIYRDPTHVFNYSVVFNESITIPYPIAGTDATNKNYVDSKIANVETIVLGYADLSGQSNIKIYDLPSGRAILSAAFMISEAFDIPIAAGISINGKVLTDDPKHQQTAVGVIDTIGRTYFNAADTTADINLFDFDTYWQTSTSWNLNTARHVPAGAGTQDAALSFGGYTDTYSAITEKFNGATWSTSGNLNTARYVLAGAGTQDAALSFGGRTTTQVAVTEKFNGATWSASGNLNTARRALAGCGLQDAALSFGGSSNTHYAVTEKFNGATWSTSGNLNTARTYLAGAGTQDAALSFGGTTGTNYAGTEKFNGATWSTSGNLNTARHGLAGAGTQDAALSFGGYTDTYSAITEKFNGATWSTSGNLNSARYWLAGCGLQDAALSFGGYTDTYSAVTEKFTTGTPQPFPTLTQGELTIYLQVV